jgi:hypothetical protein
VNRSWLPRLGHLAVAVLTGVVAGLVLATPANAQRALQPHAINDGMVDCTITGALFVPWHINTEFDINIDDLESVPAGDLYLEAEPTDPWDTSMTILQIVPPGTTTSGLTFTWTDASDPQNTGTGTGTTTQVYPTCTPQVIAEFVPDCDEPLVDVTLRNSLQEEKVFTVNGVDHVVAAGGSKTLSDVALNDKGDVEVLVEDWYDTVLLGRHHWVKGCPTPPPPATAPATTTPPLARTGTSLGGVLGLGGGLIAAGALLIGVFLVLRRRRAPHCG